MSKKVKISNRLQRKLEKALTVGLNKATEEKIVPIIKEKLKKTTKSNMKGDFKPNENAAKTDNERISNQRKKLIKTLTSDFWIEHTPLERSGNELRTIIQNTAKPNDPLWNRTKFEDATLTDWIVNGKMVIHPASTEYKGNLVPDWNDYVRNSRFQEVPFVDSTIDELRKNKSFKKKVKNALTESVIDEVNKVLKNK